MAALLAMAMILLSFMGTDQSSALGTQQGNNGVSPVPENRIPYIASIFDEWSATKHICSGVLVRPSYVITTANCVDPASSHAAGNRPVMAIGGMHAYDKHLQVRAKKVMRHEGWLPGKTCSAFNLAVLQLEEDVPLDFPQLALPDSPHLRSGHLLTAIGWAGSETMGAEIFTSLKAQDQHFLGTARCNNTAFGNGTVQAGIICGYNEKYGSLTPVDTGAPLLQLNAGGVSPAEPKYDTLVGINCDYAPGPDQYIDLRDHACWLYNNIPDMPGVSPCKQEPQPEPGPDRQISSRKIHSGWAMGCVITLLACLGGFGYLHFEAVVDCTRAASCSLADLKQLLITAVDILKKLLHVLQQLIWKFDVILGELRRATLVLDVTLKKKSGSSYKECLMTKDAELPGKPVFMMNVKQTYKICITIAHEKGQRIGIRGVKHVRMKSPDSYTDPMTRESANLTVQRSEDGCSVKIEVDWKPKGPKLTTVTPDRGDMNMRLVPVTLEVCVDITGVRDPCDLLATLYLRMFGEDRTFPIKALQKSLWKNWVEAPDWARKSLKGAYFVIKLAQDVHSVAAMFP